MFYNRYYGGSVALWLIRGRQTGPNLYTKKMDARQLFKF